MAELIDALKKDFEGYDELRYMLIHDAPKYGNDDPYVDDIAKDCVKYSGDVADSYTSIFGSHYANGLVPVMANVPHGKAIWALPSGRKARSLWQTVCRRTQAMISMARQLFSNPFVM